MAVDMFLKMPPLKGESRDKKHGEEIDVLAWSWGCSNSGSAHVGGGAGSGKVAVSDLTVHKYVDSSSTDLLLACCNGTHFDEALLTVRKSGGKAPVEYIKITMNEVLITNIQSGGSGTDDRLRESCSLNFAKVKVEYTGQDEKGAAGATMTMEWDIAGNA
ncbi:MAG: type VI secretion system tube protein Hcp [Rhodospirillales bacterium]|nr:type VI secretion system tube protein Hcp [Rhodospirillales bacterium]